MKPCFTIGDIIRRHNDPTPLTVCAIHRNSIQYEDGPYVSGIVSQSFFEKV